jgi:fucose 4-O-acetylase-like acetyltransferase
MRNETIDSLKGTLILLVIFGHIISGGHLTKYLLYAIYTFHIPLFLGLSGYLLKKELFSISILDLAKKYFYRLIIPFLLAYATYCLIQSQLLDPSFYHLWFIPAFLLFILYTFIAERLHINPVLVILLAFTFSILWIGNHGLSAVVDGFAWMSDKRYYYDFVFFFFGYYLRNTPKNFSYTWLFPSILFIPTSFYILVLNHKVEINLLYSTMWTIFNLSLIYIALRLSRMFDSIIIPYVNIIGKLSLPIYLWHIVPILILKSIVEKYGLNTYLYLVLYFLSVALIIAIIDKYKTNNFVKMMLLGEKA